jgi:hypothetical protein
MKTVYHSFFLISFFQNFHFLNYNRSNFGEPKKLVQTGFVRFHKNKSILESRDAYSCLECGYPKGGVAEK